MADKPIYPCMCDMDDDCSRECEMQVERENAQVWVEGERARIVEWLRYCQGKRDFGSPNNVADAIERGEHNG